MNSKTLAQYECLCNALMQHVLLVIIAMASWQLLHFGNSMHGYMLLAFKNPNSALFTTREMGILNIEEECGLKKHIENSSARVSTS